MEAVLPEDSGTSGEAAETPELINKSVIKATILLSKLAHYSEGVTVTELAQYVRMSRPTTFRLLLSLEQTGFVERIENKYKLGWKLARLGRLADPHRGIIARIQPTLKALAEQLNEMVGYAVVDGANLDLIAEASGSRLISLSPGFVGQDLPLHASAVGKLALAELSDEMVEELLPETLPALARRTITDRNELIRALHKIRRQGYSTLDDELEESLFALAVAVRDETGRLTGALAVTGPTQRMKSRPLAGMVAQLQDTAAEIAKILTQTPSLSRS